MDSAVAIAGIALTGSLVTPVVMSLLARAERRQQRAEAREDARLAQESATQAATAVGRVALQAEDAARLLVINNQAVAANAESQGAKLDALNKLGNETHKLVNSNMTAQMQSEYDASVLLLASLKEIVALKRKSSAPEEPSEAALSVIADTEARVADLRARLDDRAKAA